VNTVALEGADSETLLVTAEGYEELRSELETLRKDGRNRMSERLREAREDGRTDDNPALYDLFVEQAQLERRIASLEAQVVAARIVAPAADGIAGIGSCVRVASQVEGKDAVPGRHGSGVTEVTFDGLVLLGAPGRVMTPRPASEQLVAAAASRLAGRRARVADVGTGGGAIAVAIADACPGAEVWATDTSRCAVLLARANVRLHGLDGRVFVRHCDLLEDVPAPVDLIVANLPYLPASTAAEHPDLLVEPFDSVFAPGDGLGPYRRLVDAARTWLADDGGLLLQLHRQVLAATRAELSDLGAALDLGEPVAAAAA
jgi:methylase of polypeptide subunit release factors